MPPGASFHRIRKNIAMTPYDQIELFGLTETDAELPFPDDDALQIGAVETAFREITDVFTGTALATDLEPLLWGLVNLFHRQALRLQSERHRNEEVIRTLMREQDGTEIADVELQKAQSRHEHASEREIAFEFMRNHAADLYEAEIGSPWLPRAGSIKRNTVTAAIVEARDHLRAIRRREADELAPEGARVIIAGGPDFTDTAAVYAALDRTLDRLGQIVILHGGLTRGVDRIAAIWARERNIAQIVCKPDFAAHGRAAPFRRNDEMLDLTPRAVIVFPGNGISENLAQKAEAKRVAVWRPKVALVAT